MEGGCLKLPKGRAEGLVPWSRHRSFLCLVEKCKWSVIVFSEQNPPSKLCSPFLLHSYHRLSLEPEFRAHCVVGGEGGVSIPSQPPLSPLYTSPHSFPPTLPRKVVPPIPQGLWAVIALTSLCWWIHKMRTSARISAPSSLFKSSQQTFKGS